MTAKSKKLIILSAAVAALCAAAIAITLCLVLKKDSGGGHIAVEEGGVAAVRGELDLSLTREGLETVTLDKNGLPKKTEDFAAVDFTKSKDNIFGIGEHTLIGPQCYFTADMAIKNLKPYGFEYWLEIIPENGDNLLTDQLKLSVTVGDEIFIERTLQSGLITKVFPAVLGGATDRFRVKLEYLDVQNNDDTKNTTLAFDMIVHARLTKS